MLDDYKERQPVVFNLLMNEINSNRVSHAYLIDENSNGESFDIVMSFIKTLLSSNLDEVSKKKLCKRIDDGNYPEIKIIEPDGMTIKKQQIIDLQKDFSMSAVEGYRRIYIIRDADKMRGETANSMLKFLEEPNDGIVAILMTNNVNSMLSTIISRCQIIKLQNDSVDNTIDEFIINFASLVEKNAEDVIVNENKYLFDFVNPKDREKIEKFIDKLIDIYYDILKLSNGCNVIDYQLYIKELEEIAKKNTYNQLLDKIDYLLNLKDKIKYNVNVNLLVDNLIIKLGGIYECSWS